VVGKRGTPRSIDVLRKIVADGLKPTLLGIGIGIVAALALGRVLGSLVLGIRRHRCGHTAVCR